MKPTYAMKPTCALAALLLVAAAVAGGCGAIPTQADRRAVDSGSRFEKTLRSYHVVHSDHNGKVGFMKVYDVQERGGPSYEWRYVYDLQFNEVGFIDQFGNAHRETPYTPSEASYQTASVRVSDMPSDSFDRNVMRMLGMNPATDSVSFPPASNADISGR